MEPVFDEALAYPATRWLRGAVDHGDWPAVAGFLGSLRDDDERTAYAEIVTERPGAERMLAVAAERDRGTLARVLLARRQIVQAWEIRTGKRAEHVSAEQFRGMHEYLRSAERQLIDVTAREPGNVMAWAARLITARGLELGQSEARRRYDRLAAHNPHHYGAQSLLVQQLCPKWGGSWEAVDAFVEECLRTAPPGGLQGALPAVVELERWSDADHDEGIARLKRPEVLRVLERGARSSVLHPAFRRRPGWVSAHGVFALLFSFADDEERAAVHFRAMGDHASAFPWNYTGDPGPVFTAFRDWALTLAAAR